jgi:hypothetical protein
MLTEESLSLDLRRSVLALRAAALVVEAESGEIEAMSQDNARFAAVADLRTR